LDPEPATFPQEGHVGFCPAWSGNGEEDSSLWEG